MGRKRIEQLIPCAMQAIQETMFKDGKKQEIPREFKGYISSFGASIIQNGLIPTVTFFQNKEVRTMQDRTIINMLIFKMLKDNSIKDMLGNISVDETNDLLEIIKVNKEYYILMCEWVMDAATALKLAMRTFKIQEKEEGE